jgi:hypothetical protein
MVGTSHNKKDFLNNKQKHINIKGALLGALGQWNKIPSQASNSVK